MKMSTTWVALSGVAIAVVQADNHLSKPELVDVDLGAEATALFDFFEALAEDAGIALRLSGGAPPVRGDRLMLRRAMCNLISNALRYTPWGGAVDVRLSAADRCVELQICNPGPTIEPQHVKNLFDRFYRADPSRQRKGEGAGLGLAIVPSIVEAHAGKVGVESADGMTRFWMKFPSNHAIDAQQRVDCHADS